MRGTLLYTGMFTYNLHGPDTAKQVVNPVVQQFYKPSTPARFTVSKRTHTHTTDPHLHLSCHLQGHL